MKSDLNAYVKTADMNTALGNKQDKLPVCASGQVVKFNTANALWECAADNDTHVDLTGYASKEWVSDQDYLAAANAAGTYVAKSDLDTTLGDYLKIADLQTAINGKLKAGTGISITSDVAGITISNTVTQNIFKSTANHLAETAPDANIIYIDSSADPATQWIYNGGGADPSLASSWTQIGSTGMNLSDYYTKEQADGELADKQDKLPTCTNGQVVKYDAANSTWKCAADSDTTYDLSKYATQDWASSNFLTSSALTAYAKTADMQTALANKQDKLPTCAAGQVVKYSTTAPNWICANDNDTYYDLTPYATQDWVKGQGYLTETKAASAYVTQSSLATTLAGYQQLITGGATTITSANLDPNQILSSNANGKVAVSGVTLSQLQTALGAISALQTQQAANTAAIAAQKAIDNNAYGDYAEAATGRMFRGKPTYRQTFTGYISAPANSQYDFRLISTQNYVDSIVYSAGFYMTGNNQERYQVGAAYGNTITGFVLVSNDEYLTFRTQSSMQRNGQSNGTAYIIVEYTKK
jgi:hypothetical protein